MPHDRGEGEALLDSGADLLGFVDRGEGTHYHPMPGSPRIGRLGDRWMVAFTTQEPGGLLRFVVRAKGRHL